MFCNSGGVSQIPTLGIIVDFNKLTAILKKRALRDSYHKPTAKLFKNTPSDTILGTGQHYAIFWCDNELTHIHTSQIPNYLLVGNHFAENIKSNALPFFRGDKQKLDDGKKPRTPTTGCHAILPSDHIKALALEEIRVRKLAITTLNTHFHKFGIAEDTIPQAIKNLIEEGAYDGILAPHKRYKAGHPFH